MHIRLGYVTFVKCYLKITHELLGWVIGTGDRFANLRQKEEVELYESCISQADAKIW